MKKTADYDITGRTFYRWLKKPATLPLALVIALITIVASFFFNQVSGVPAIGIDWPVLEQVKFIPEWNSDYGTRVGVPVFSDTISRLNGKEVEITGYYIPMELNSTRCALSKNPNSSCFFCGKATIETVMIIDFKHRVPNFTSDDLITVHGNLRVMHSVNDFIYKLVDAHVVRVNK